MCLSRQKQLYTTRARRAWEHVAFAFWAQGLGDLRAVCARPPAGVCPEGGRRVLYTVQVGGAP